MYILFFSCTVYSKEEQKNLVWKHVETVFTEERPLGAALNFKPAKKT